MQLFEENQKETELNQMKRRATALFWIVTLVFVLAAILEKRYDWLRFVRATAEAAMVGAIADWFAVTALFRHPLNIPIPHTAIIPNRKDSIGRSLGGFVRNNFLVREVISTRLRSMNVARRVAHWVSQPEHIQGIAHHAASALTGMIQVVRDEDVQELIERGIITRARSISVAPLLGRMLGMVLSGQRRQELLTGIVQLSAHLLAENKGALREQISRETPWWMPWQVDETIYQKIVGSIQRTLREVQSDPQHPLRDKFNDIVDRFVEDLRHSPDTLARGEALKEELLVDPVVREFSSSLWSDIKTMLLEHSDNPDSDFHQPIQRGVIRFGEALLNDQALLDKIDRWVEQAVLYFIEEYGHEVAQLITQTVSGWDAEATARKIEIQVGRDLQFIRINGTIVGGLVGLLIYCVSLLLA
jgi:uncharacterized membrane-anchored protein YjiN (DUF445 family)